MTDPRLEQVVQIIQQMWNQAGFDITVSAIQQATLITDFITGNFQAATSYQFGAVDPDLNYVWFSTTTVSPVGRHRPQLPPQLRPPDRVLAAVRPHVIQPDHP